MTSKRKAGRWAMVAGMLAAAAVTVGCEAVPDHLPVSMDRHVYHSTVQLPTNVAIVEPYSGEVLWSMEIPVEHKLTMDFGNKDMEFVTISGKPATKMKWWLTGDTDKSGTVTLPGTPVKMDISYRPSPEFPEGKMPASLQKAVEPVRPTAPQEIAPPAGEKPAPPPESAVPPANSDAVEKKMNEDVKAAEPIESTEPADAAK